MLSYKIEEVNSSLKSVRCNPITLGAPQSLTAGLCLKLLKSTI